MGHQGSSNPDLSNSSDNVSIGSWEVDPSKIVPPEKFSRRHLVLEALVRKRNNFSSSLFLREFDFYSNYKASLNQGKCFWCNQQMLLYANYPCKHFLWCSDCKTEVLRASGNCVHLCVVCDMKVEGFILPSPQPVQGKLQTVEKLPPHPSHVPNA